ncbi:hypothetical protein BDF21DRAFT_428756 [Thamnidium elegans]|nr:hypothetical protein BDF21DRAFT_428756 [Thamnidium elegans]
MVHLLLRTPSFYAVMSVYYILRFSVAFYSTLTTRTKQNLYCSQRLVKRFRNSKLEFIDETPRIIGLWIKSYQKLDLKQKNLTRQYPSSVTSKQYSIKLRYNKSLCSELLERGKLNTKFKNGVNLIKFNSKELEGLCKQFDQNKDWVSSLSSYPSINQLQHTFQLLMNTCLLIDSSLDHKLEQGYAFKSICDFILGFIDQTHLQLEELTDASISKYQVNYLASKVSAGLDFIEELLQSPLVEDIHLHWICVDHINILIDRCFALGERINERK